MLLERLIASEPLVLRQGSGGVEVTDLVDDSRMATPGCAFVARAGAEADGRSFIRGAVDRGAVAVISEEGADLPRNVALATGPGIDQVLAGRLAERFFGHPSRKLSLIGVTGTNGKTTTAFLIQHLLRLAGVPAGMISTVWIDDGGDGGRPSTLTTPGAIELSRWLSRMVRNGCRAAVAEVSSHALHQGRTAAVGFDTAVFTNLTGDHLDYHPDMDAYAAAKARLFSGLRPDAWGVFNADDRYAPRMARDCSARKLWTTLGEASRSDDQPLCRAAIGELTTADCGARFDGPWGSLDLRLPLVGRHNVANALQAAAAANTITDVARVLRRGLESCPLVPGRLEPVRRGAGGRGSDVQTEPSEPCRAPTVLVDYAHTHDALENSLRALRSVTRGSLIVLFGCGGDRDRTKRPKMAEVACRLADRVFITSDNPRTEDPEAIIADIVAGVRPGWTVSRFHSAGGASKDRVFVTEDRAEAIRCCVLSAGVDDTVLLAGKGHEDYQIIGTRKRHFDDREQAAAALELWCRQHAAPCPPPP